MGGEAGGLNLGFGFDTTAPTHHHQLPPQKLIRSDAFPFSIPPPSSTMDGNNPNTNYGLDYTSATAPHVSLAFRSQGLQPVMAQPYPLFTPGQWQELHQQAMIYKHLVSSVPIPLDLLLGTGSFSPLYSERVGRGGLQFSTGGSTDPEPGRCRRTDGKKWRCSRDAVPDQKYCERHLNRGRPRSRKPVEKPTKTPTASAPLPSSRSSTSNWMEGEGICMDFCAGSLSYNSDAKMQEQKSGIAHSVERNCERSSGDRRVPTPGGPLAEVLQQSHVGYEVADEGAACGSYIDVMMNGRKYRAEGERTSPTRVLPSPTDAPQRGSLLSLSDSSGNSSPTFAAVGRRPELCPP